uniref:Putative glucose-6-phosphate translocase n=1 Tax=Ornithodoros turicata TaxID=34597 RepID=A0A2R5LBD1_9ACAR
MDFKRYQLTVFTTMFVGYACYAYNRKCVSFAMPELIEDGLSKEQVGMIASSQNFAYAISKFLGGVLSDRISARLLFVAGLVFSGLATLLFGSMASTIWLYSAFWFMNGLAQGCGWPSCAKILRHWYSPSQFGTWWSVLSASANISGGVAPFVSTLLILNYGWRFSLMVAGVISVVLGLIAFFTLVNSPEDVGYQGFAAAKSEEKTAEKSGSNKDSSSDATVMDLLISPFLWLVSFSYLVVFCAKTSAVDWGQLFLMEDLKHTQYLGSTLTSSIETGGFFGGILAGYLTDWFLHLHTTQANRHKGNPRIPVAVIFMAGVAICLHLLRFNVTEDSGKLWISCLGFVLGACLYGPIAIFGVAASESAPPHLSGTSHAIVALAASIGAVISGLPFSYIADWYNWGAIFFLLEIVCGITALMLFLGRNLSCKMGRRIKED